MSEHDDISLAFLRRLQQIFGPHIKGIRMPVRDQHFMFPDANFFLCRKIRKKIVVPADDMHGTVKRRTDIIFIAFGVSQVDQEGYVWVATHYGIGRYDGYQFLNYGTQTEPICLKNDVIYVSHRMEEIRRIASCATVMRDGQVAGDVMLENTSTPVSYTHLAP